MATSSSQRRADSSQRRADSSQRRADPSHNRVESPPPLAPVGPTILTAGLEPEFGVFSDAPPTVDYDGLTEPHGRNRIQRFLRQKRWMYVFAATDEVVIIAAVVDAGPTGTGFVMVTDRATGEVLADASRPGGAGPLTGVNERPIAGHRSHYAVPGTAMTVRGDDHELRVRASLHSIPFLPIVSDPWIELDLRLATDAHPAITAVTQITQDPPMVTATVKNAALPARGELTLRQGGKESNFSLSGGMGGFDYTNGFLPRHTAWRWAFTTAPLADGRSFGLNLVSGFSGIGDRSHENACWVDGVAHPLSPAARIEFDREDMMAPWQIRTLDGAVDLTFTPLTVHRESLNLGVVRSRFIQPTGHYSGTVTVAGETIAIDALPGVVEDQDVLW